LSSNGTIGVATVATPNHTAISKWRTDVRPPLQPPRPFPSKGGLYRPGRRRGHLGLREFPDNPDRDRLPDPAREMTDASAAVHRVAILFAAA
jgi:hypothetical protein